MVVMVCVGQSIWENQFYYLFGFLFVVFIIIVISCSQIAIVMTYFQLCGEVGRCYFVACESHSLHRLAWNSSARCGQNFTVEAANLFASVYCILHSTSSAIWWMGREIAIFTHTIVKK